MAEHDEQLPRHERTAIAERDLPFALFIESVKDYAIFMLDSAGHVLTWNVGAERMKGYRDVEIVGRHFSVFYPQEDQTADKPARMLAAAARNGRTEDEGLRVRKDGTRFWAHVVITAVRDRNGELLGFGKVTRDMTDVRARRAALEAANAELRNANEALEAFTRSMTHDVAGPLRSIRGFTEILLDEYVSGLDDEARDYLRRVDAGAQRLSNLVQGLVTFLRMTRSGQTPPLDRVSWDTVASDVVKDLQFDINERAATIHVVAPLGHVLGYREFAIVVLENLLRNAMKYVGPGIEPNITIAAERVDRWLRLTVQDNGIGVRQADMQTIFEPFKRLHARAEFEGSGLGLTIVRHAVTRMGGRCGVESEPGTGSRFWVDLYAAD